MPDDQRTGRALAKRGELTSVIGVGIDVVEVERFRRIMAERPRVLDRLFTADERSLAEERKDPAQRYSSRFAAKEAAMKAMGVGLGEVLFAELEVVRAESGAPSLIVSGSALLRADDLGITSFQLSISDTPLVAQAIVIASG